MKDYYTTKRQENIKMMCKNYTDETLDYILDSKPIPEEIRRIYDRAWKNKGDGWIWVCYFD